MKIRSLLLTAVLVTAVLCSPIAVSASSLTSTQISAIISLLSAFGADSATIANVQNVLNGNTPSINASPVAWCHVFNTNLGVGSLGNEVAALHRALNKEGFNDTSWRADNFTKITGSAVVKFQKKYGIPQTGFVGPLTRAKLNALYKCGAVSQNITINSVSGPNSLNVGQTGTWTVNASAPSGTNLSYSVDWGEMFYNNGVAGTGGFNTVQTTATFTHIYNQAGTYTVKFNVSGPNPSCPPCPTGAFCATCIANNNSAKTSITVVVGNSTQPSITITSPNGGETLTAGQQITVRWNSYNLNHPVGITLVGQNNTQFFLGNWVASSIGSETVTIPATVQAGNYKINISTPPESSSGAEDTSDNYFTISSSTQPSITVTSPNGGETWKVGETHNITWQDNFTTSNNIVRIVLISQGAGILGLIYQGVDNGYYAWNGQVSVGAGQYSGPGDYKLKICKGDACDDSDNYFTITQ